VIVAFRERRTDFAEDLVAIHFSDDEIVQKVFASIRNEYFLNLDDTPCVVPDHLRRERREPSSFEEDDPAGCGRQGSEGFVLPADVFFRFVMGNATLRRQIEQLDKLFEVIKTTPR